MAIYHLHVKNIGRRDGRSAVAAAAYRAGETLPNDAEERLSKFGGRRDVVFAEMVLPGDAPAWMSERGRFWNALEARMKRKDARFAKEIEAALPRELPRAHWKAVALTLARIYAERGIVVDVAIHDDGTNHNPHFHMLLSNLTVSPEGFGGANRSLIRPDFLKEARSLWAKIVNTALGNVGSSATIDPRSHRERGIGREPGEHRAPNLAERRARRQDVHRREPAMNLDAEFVEARKELLREPDVLERYPNLSARPDWPPLDRLPPYGLSVAELQEHRKFWHEVEGRVFSPTLDERQPEPARPERTPELAEREEQRAPQARREYEHRQQELRNDFPEWETLHRELVRRLEREGHDTGSPLHDPQFVKAALEKFEARLYEARALREENARLRAQWNAFEREQERTMPVPDPAGDPISRDQLDRKRDELVEMMHQPADTLPTTPRPEQAPAQEREAAAAAVQRMGDIDVPDRTAVGPDRVLPHEQNTRWLAEPAAAREPERAAPATEDAYSWLDAPTRSAKATPAHREVPDWLRPTSERKKDNHEDERERQWERERP